MKCMTTGECADWWQQMYRSTSLVADPGQGPAAHTSRIATRSDSLTASAIRPLAVSCSEWLHAAISSDAVLVWITGYAIWNAEDWNLYYRFRESFGVMSHLEDAPGHLFLLHERESVTSLLCLALLFSWDVTVGCRTGTRAMRLDHDGHFALWDELAQHRESLAELIGNLDRKAPKG